METLSEAAHLQQSSRHPGRVHIPRKSVYYLRHILEFRAQWAFLKYSGIYIVVERTAFEPENLRF
jgi:hypothetical protein